MSGDNYGNIQTIAIWPESMHGYLMRTLSDPSCEHTRKL